MISTSAPSSAVWPLARCPSGSAHYHVFLCGAGRVDAAVRLLSTLRRCCAWVPFFFLMQVFVGYLGCDPRITMVNVGLDTLLPSLPGSVICWPQQLYSRASDRIMVTFALAATMLPYVLLVMAFADDVAGCHRNPLWYYGNCFLVRHRNHY